MKYRHQLHKPDFLSAISTMTKEPQLRPQSQQHHMSKARQLRHLHNLLQLLKKTAPQYPISRTPICT
eukprot:5780412-Ditylum_brightwellii.AAC.1